jgi:tripartite-type tricarboxylate transporter receptor subunit TctC
MVALLGGHLELASANPGEALAQMEAKKVKVLSASTSQRLTLPRHSRSERARD